MPGFSKLVYLDSYFKEPYNKREKAKRGYKHPITSIKTEICLVPSQVKRWMDTYRVWNEK